MWYLFTRFMLRLIFFTVFRLKVTGKDNVPSTGSVVLCANHISLLDPPLVGTPLQRKVHYMAKEELFAIPGLGWYITQLGAFPVKRGGVSKDSIRLASRLLDEQNVIGVFPEGTRSNAGGAGKKGAASLALKSNAVVIPVAIVGNYRPLRRMHIIYGKPLDLSAFGDHSRDSIEGATEKIMSAIRQLLAQYGNTA